MTMICHGYERDIAEIGSEIDFASPHTANTGQ